MNKILSGFSAVVLAFCAQFSQAGIINTTTNSFIDSSTGLEWMDFGVNNQRAYNQVVAELTTTWAGWSLANESQVMQLWHNAFSGKGSDNDVTYPGNGFYARYDDYTNGQSVHEATFDAMGCNILNGNSCYSLGWFADTSGSLSYVYFNDYNVGNDMVHAYGRNVNYDSFRTNTSSYYSTMLVKSANVPEGSALMFLMLGLAAIGVNSRYRRG